ncbi:hypothetical protein [Microbacterium kunmingense]|uniref:hypothetical protein n=1 Tax=Microbacterium kunmingense TaxID=2915939 RepID=UPI0020046043|nr:hypothetical protein [Microbacterium kunmingense]
MNSTLAPKKLSDEKVPTCLFLFPGYGEGMFTTAPLTGAALRRNAGVVRAALDIAGARHEVLPPRITAAEAVSPQLSTRRAPP